MKLTKSQLKEIIEDVIKETAPTSWKAGTTYEDKEDLDEQDLDKVQIPGTVKEEC